MIPSTPRAPPEGPICAENVKGDNALIGGIVQGTTGVVGCVPVGTNAGQVDDCLIKLI